MKDEVPCEDQGGYCSNTNRLGAMIRRKKSVSTADLQRRAIKESEVS